MVQYQDDGFAGLGKSFHQVKLILGEGKVCQITGVFAVRVLTNASHDVVGSCSGSCSFLYLRSVFFPPVATLLIVTPASSDDILRTEFIGEGLEDGIMLACMLIGLVTLPRVGPAAVEATHLELAFGPVTSNFLPLPTARSAVLLFFSENAKDSAAAWRAAAANVLATKQGEVFQIIIGLFEQIETVLQAQYTADSIVNAAHGDFPFFHQLLQESTELPVVHGTIDMSIPALIASLMASFLSLTMWSRL